MLGSKIVKSRKFESRVGKMIRIFELGQTDIAFNKHRMDMVKLNLQTSVGYDAVLILKGGVLGFGEMTSHFIKKSLPTFLFKIRT